MSRFLQLIGLCLVACGLTGCAGYHLGPVIGGAPVSQSVAVLPFNNQTMQPRLGDAVTQAVRERVQTDGACHLVNRDEADIVITGTITHYGREPLSFLATDAYTPDNYRVGVVAHVVARERATGRLVFEKDIKGFTLMHVGTDLNSADLQSQSLLAQDLAHNVVEQLTEGTW